MELTDMVMSMTGYGRSIMHIDDSDITVEIRAVNNRFADVSVKLPRSLTYCEDKVKSELLKRVNRGKIDVFKSDVDYLQSRFHVEQRRFDAFEQKSRQSENAPSVVQRSVKIAVPYSVIGPHGKQQRKFFIER